MHRFFFHVHNGVGFVEDEGGRELPDLDCVREEAIKGIRSILSDEVTKGVIDLRGRIDIADPTGRIVLTVSFEEAFTTFRGSV